MKQTRGEHLQQNQILSHMRENNSEENQWENHASILKEGELMVNGIFNQQSIP
jgi:hypothetical protein